MIPFGDKTVTIYNRYIGQDGNGRTTITWFRHVLSGCFWHDTDATVTVGETKLNAHELTCKIPQSNAYLPYDQWAAAGVDRTAFFTLSVDDMIALGNVPYVIGNRYTANDVRELCRRTGIMLVTSESDNTDRPLPHYAAKGV